MDNTVDSREVVEQVVRDHARWVFAVAKLPDRLYYMDEVLDLAEDGKTHVPTRYDLSP